MTPEERKAAIVAASGPRIIKLIRAAIALAADPKITSRGERAMDICEELSRIVTPHTPCKDGCAHCCYMATCITGYEARMIGRYIGKTPAKLGRELQVSIALEDDLRARFTGVRCPFLSSSERCTIYAVRPAACRVHHVVNDTNEQCKITPGSPLKTAHLNFQPVAAALAMIFIDEDFGDIREFFPPEQVSQKEKPACAG